MRLVVVLVCIGALAWLIYAVLSAWIAQRLERDGPWRVDTVARPDGTLVVVVVRAGSEQTRTVCELPAGMEAVEFASELRLAREDAQMQADELNRAAGSR